MKGGSLSALPKLASWPALPSRLIVPPFLYQCRSLVQHNQGEAERGKSESQNSILASNMESEAISRSPVVPMSNHPLNSSVTGVHSTPGGLGFPNLTKSVHILHAHTFSFQADIRQNVCPAVELSHLVNCRDMVASALLRGRS